MQIPFLDALLTPAAGKPSQNSPEFSDSKAFEALLAGLNAPAVPLPDEQPIATPGATLPPTGKILPEVDGMIGPGLFADDQVADSGIADRAFDPLSDEPSDEPNPDAAATLVFLPIADALAPFLPPAAPTTATLLPPPARADAADKSANPPPSFALPAEQTDTDQPSKPTTTPRIASPAQYAPHISLPPQSATLAPEPGASGAPGSGAAEAPKPAQPFVAGLAIAPTGAQLVADAAAPSPLRRGHDSKFAPVSLAIAPDASPGASYVVPVAILAAPGSVAAGLAALDAAPAGVQVSGQSPVQPIALPDHRALVDALVRARAERDPGVSVALETREFGAVALRFETLQSATGERGLQVALSSADPEFERAVASAAAAQAMLADQSGRNPANRVDPAPTRSGEPFGDALGGRAAQSEQQQPQQRSGSPEPWREARSRHSAEALFSADGRADASAPTGPRPDRRRGSIFA